MQALLMLVLAAQLDKPPEFSEGRGFQKSAVDAAIDSAAHTSGQKSESAKWMVRSLGDWKRGLSDGENASWAASMALLGRGALAEAAESFGKGAKAFPGSVRQRVGEAAAAYAQGQYERAAAVLLAAGQLHAKEIRLIPYLVEVREADARVAGQLKAWALAYPKSAEAQWAYGLCLMEASPGAAARVLEESARLAGGGDARPYLALARLAGGDVKKAIVYLSSAVQADPRNAEAHYRLAMAYQQGGNRAEAEKHMEIYKSLKR